MRSFVRKHPQYALMGGQGRKRLYLYEISDPLSVAWASANVTSRGREPVPLCEVKKLKFLNAKPNNAGLFGD